MSNVPAVHYVARNTVEITVRDINKLGPVLGAVLEGGANQMHGIEFGLADPAPSRIQARTLAIADAQRQAKQMADAAGVKLGRVLAIRSSDAAGPMPHGGGMRAEAFSSKVAVSGGTLNIEESVELRFELVAP